VIPRHTGSSGSRTTHRNDDDATWTPDALGDRMSSGLRFSPDDDDAGSFATMEHPSPSPVSQAMSVVAGFQSHPNSLIHWFWATPWIDEHLNKRCTVKVFLGSFPFKCVTMSVAPGGLFLNIRTEIPEEALNVDKFNASVYKTLNGTPKYGKNHFKTIADKDVVGTVRNNPQDKVFSVQSILLPYKCQEEFTDLEGHPGQQFKRFKSGMKVALCELIAAGKSHNRGYRSDISVGIDNVSYVGGISNASAYTFAAQTQAGADGASVFSVDVRTGHSVRRQQGVPQVVNANTTTTNTVMEEADASYFEETVATGSDYPVDANPSKKRRSEEHVGLVVTNGVSYDDPEL
jgi:hypothetical protein